MTDNVLQPTYNKPSDELTSMDSVKSSAEHPMFSSKAATQAVLPTGPSAVREYNPPSSNQTDWTGLQSSKDDTTAALSAASTPGVEVPGSFPRSTGDQLESQTSAAGTWDATINGLKNLLPSREAVTNTLTAAQTTAQTTAQEYVPKATQGVKSVVDTVSGYLPGAPPTFPKQEASTPMPANEYGGAPFNRGLNSTNQVDAADLDQPQISDDAIAEAAQRLAKKSPLAGPERPFSESTRSQSDVLADKGEPVPRPTTHAPAVGGGSIPDTAEPHETTSHISTASSLPSRPHHMPPAFGSQQSQTSIPPELPPTPPAKDAKDELHDPTLQREAAGETNIPQVQSTPLSVSAAKTPADDGSKAQSTVSPADTPAGANSPAVQSGVHLIPTQEHILHGKTVSQSIADAPTPAATDSDYVEANHRTPSTPSSPAKHASTHDKSASQGLASSPSIDSSQSQSSDGSKPKLKDRLRGEVKVLTGKIKHDDKLVEEGRRLKNGSTSSY